MKLARIPFEVVDWSTVDVIEYPGDAGVARWRTRTFDDVRVRMVEYSPGYSANHWCSKGHVLLCLTGELITELQDGRSFTLGPGMSYQVADSDGAHRSMTHIGATLFIVD